jgi:putative membrane protein
MIMRHLAFGRAAIALGILMTGPALAESLGEKTGINSVLDVAPTTHDFVSEAAMSDMFEIQSSKLAQEKGDAATKSFASQMIEDHTKTSSDLKSLISTGTVKEPLPDAMSSSQQSMLDKLKGLSGADFEKQYRSDQVSAHKDAVSLFQRYAKGGDNETLKAWAAKTEPHLEGHLKMAQDLEK